MKANELMIGDWLRTSRGIAKVIAVDKIGLTFEIDGGDFDIDEYDEEEWFDALPITAEILEKNGFESTSASSERVWKRNGQEVWLDNEGKNYWANIKNGEFYFEGYIEHAHELQHCLKLVGIDKTIEL